MIQILLRRFGIMLLVILLQVFVFNHISLWGYAVPLLGIMVLFYMPLNAGRKSSMFMAFFTGLVLDAFSNTPGVAAGAMTATAFVQYPFLHSIAPKDVVEDSVPWQGRIHLIYGHSDSSASCCIFPSRGFYVLQCI